MANPLFSISNLKCGYKDDHIVLEVPSLILPAGKLIFVIGPSGSGKSTFLETLGLMNNTIVQSQATTFKLYSNNQALELVDIWNKHEKEISRIRQQHFSFLFQSTNLMPNFTAGENMCLALLLADESFSKAKERVIELMPLLDLDTSLFYRRTAELSGGQRQRIAFIRAFVGPYHVLFGDEPTGNLDHGAARRLMNVLKKETIQSKGKSGIIVSHDLTLAEEYADIIVPISWKVNEQGSANGFIQKEKVVHRMNEGWSFDSGESIGEITPILKDIVLSTSVASFTETV